MDSDKTIQEAITKLTIEVARLSVIQDNVVNWQVAEIKQTMTTTLERLNALNDHMENLKDKHHALALDAVEVQTGFESQVAFNHRLENAYNVVIQNHHELHDNQQELAADVASIKSKINPMHSLYSRVVTVSLCLALTALMITNSEILTYIWPKIVSLVKAALAAIC